MTETPEPILSATEAKKRFFVYLAIKFAGLGLLIGGLFLAQGGITIGSGLMLLVGAASFFLRPRHLGLTRPER